MNQYSNTHLFKKPIPENTVFAVLACTHWLEAMDERHRYGSLLRPYYDVWLSAGAPENFFFWLDYGEGRFVDLANASCTPRNVVSRVQLERSCVEYCSEKEREQYRVIVHNGSLVWVSERNPGCGGSYSCVDTKNQLKWIFVIDLCRNMYVNKKKKRAFHHSSFVAGQPVMAAGRISVRDGLVVCIGPNSGHYRTSWDQMLNAVDHFFGKLLHTVTPYFCGVHAAECVRVVPRQLVA